MTICLSSSQWEELEKHLPLDACPNRVGLPEFTMIQENDFRPLLDEAQYETLIGIARAHCSDLVPLIERQNGLPSISPSVHRGARRRDMWLCSFLQNDYCVIGFRIR